MTVLCYHSVEPDWDSPLAVRPEEFRAQAAWLRRRRQVLPVREALPRLDRRGRLPSRTAALTFDDGFSGLYEHVLPVLVREKLPATVFLVAETLTPGGRPVDWVDTPGAVPSRRSISSRCSRCRTPASTSSRTAGRTTTSRS